MDKKSKAQIILERVEMLDVIIENKLIEQRQWKDLALSITANMDGERVKSSGATTSRMADAVVKCITMEEEIADAVENLITEKKKIVGALEKMDNATWYKILHMRYIQYIKLKDIAEQLDKDYDWVTTNHGRALKSVQELMKN